MQGRFSAPQIGTLETDLVRHFLHSLATEARMNLHILLHYGANAHHEVEAIFKGFGRAFDAATQIDPRLGAAIPRRRASSGPSRLRHGRGARPWPANVSLLLMTMRRSAGADSRHPYR